MSMASPYPFDKEARLAERRRRRELKQQLEEMGMGSQLWIDCPVHGPRQPVHPFSKVRVCMHCHDAKGGAP